MSRRQVHRPDTPCDQGLTSGTFRLESSLRHNHSSLEMSRYWHLADIPYLQCPLSGAKRTLRLHYRNFR